MLQSTNDILVIKGFAVTEMLRIRVLILIAVFHISLREGKDSSSEFCTIATVPNTTEQVLFFYIILQ